jgi:hypothetical protein
MDWHKMGTRRKDPFHVASFGASLFKSNALRCGVVLR